MGASTPPCSPGFAPPHQHQRRERDAGRVLVLNATYEPINVCTVRRATVLLLKQKAELIERAKWSLRSEHTTLPRPMVIRLVSYVHVPRDTHRRKITRRAVFARDGWTCQYCGSRSNLTVDHVIPRSKGGASTWENIVASCAPCNRRKGDLLPAQANMMPRRKPRAPNPHVFIHVASPTIPSAWTQWLPDAAGHVGDNAGGAGAHGASTAAGVAAEAA
jgi:5-methylcytosine-specific restriction endonuclease McrA